MAVGDLMSMTTRWSVPHPYPSSPHHPHPVGRVHGWPHPYHSSIPTPIPTRGTGAGVLAVGDLLSHLRVLCRCWADHTHAPGCGCGDEGGGVSPRCLYRAVVTLHHPGIAKCWREVSSSTSSLSPSVPDTLQLSAYVTRLSSPLPAPPLSSPCVTGD